MDFTFQLNNLIDTTKYQPVPEFFSQNDIRFDGIPSIVVDNRRYLYLTKCLKSGIEYDLISKNLACVKVYGYINQKPIAVSKDRIIPIGSKIVQIYYNGNSLFIDRNDIKSCYLVDKLPTIGILFDVAKIGKFKRGEIINQMINNSLNAYGFYKIDDLKAMDPRTYTWI